MKAKLVKESIQVPFSNKNRNAPISGSYPLSRLHYENADKRMGFTEDSDPIKDMGIGLTPEELILQKLIEIAGDTKIFWKKTQQELDAGTVRDRDFLFYLRIYDINHSLPMYTPGWAELKKEFNWKQIPKKYIDKTLDSRLHMYFNFFRYTSLFADIFGGSWYFDGTDLVQDDQTIVNLFAHQGITFEELVEEVYKNASKKRKR